MKKHTIEQAAQLLANKTHSVYSDINNFETLRKVLKLAFPKDEATESYNLDEYEYYGYSILFSGIWSDVGHYLEDLTIIHLSSIVDESKKVIYTTNEELVNHNAGIETVTISKADYDRFLKLENKEKKADQKFLDKCAISAMKIMLKTHALKDYIYIPSKSLAMAKEMLSERKKQQNDN